MSLANRKRVLLPLETLHTERSEHQLIHAHSFESGNRRVSLGKGERPGQETEPMKLNWGHEETV